MKNLAKYLVNYLNQELSDGVMPLDDDFFIELVEQGFRAYQATENRLITDAGGNCPTCGVMMKLGEDSLFDNAGNPIEVSVYTCPECGYILYC